MVDLIASNLKLKQRSRNILRRSSFQCQSLSDEDLDALLSRCNHSVKLAILVAETGESVKACEGYFETTNGVLADAMTSALKTNQQTTSDAKSSRPFVLCIDGGGTKCAAVVTDGDNVLLHGYAGPCNL
jgi:N-acetylmuramic acid 6-phosphate etherase